MKRYPKMKRILLTCGKKGAVILKRNGERIPVPAVGDRVVSTVGAGDSFGAAWLVHFLQTSDEKKAGDVASRISGFVVSQKEAVPDYQIEDYLK